MTHPSSNVKNDKWFKTCMFSRYWGLIFVIGLCACHQKLPPKDTQKKEAHDKIKATEKINAGPKTKKLVVKRIKTAQALPQKVNNSTCNDQTPNNPTKWVDSKPHTPLAIVSGPSIIKPNETCCKFWGDRTKIWQELDAYGHPVAQTKVTGGKGYDLTQCYELKFESHKVLDKTKKGTGIHVSANHHLPARSANLSEQDAAQIKQILSPLYRAFQAPMTTQSPLVFHTQIKAAKPKENNAQVCAIYGGALLTILCKSNRTPWSIKYLDHQIFTSYDNIQGDWVQKLNEPILVVDMNADGWVEIIVHQNEGASWWDIVLQYQQDDSQPWKQVSSSVGSATI